MKILVISSYLPYPLFSGGHVRLYNILKLLSQKHEITLVCEKRKYQTGADVAELEKFCKKVIAVQRKKQWSLQTIVQTGFSSYPFLLQGHTNPALQDAISEELKNPYDLIHVETFYVMQNLPAGGQAFQKMPPVVLTEHNIEYLVYERYVKQASLLLRPLLMIDVSKLKKWEEYFWEKADALVAVSEEEKAVMGKSDVAIVHNGVDLTTYSFQDPDKRFVKQKKRILFIGNFDWIQNKKAAEFIVGEIWPKILMDERSKNLELWVVGKNIPENIKNSGISQAVFDEHAPDETVKIYNDSFLLLAPIKVGGGTSYKVLEAMATGLPVITTKLGLEGIEGENGKDVLLAESAEEFAEQVFKIVKDKKLFRDIAKNGSELVRKNYNWEVIVEKMEEVYVDALRS